MPWRRAVPLFSGGKLSHTYGGGEIDVPVPDEPEMSRRVLLVAVISGHGQEEGFGCAEFCESNHVFRVGGDENFTAALAFSGGVAWCRLKKYRSTH